MTPPSFLQVLLGQTSIRPLTSAAEIAVTAFGLGVAACFAISLVLSYFAGWTGVWCLAWGCYLALVQVWFHMSEFLIAAQYRPHDTYPYAFMIYHSSAYVMAQSAAYIEFFVETFLVPESWKLVKLQHPAIVAIGVLGVLVFYGIRMVAMIQCAESFALQVEYDKRPEHKLVRRGLYKVFRHPSYFGWFYNIIFSQLIFGNPICLVGFTLVTWKFFADRIPDEEAELQSKRFFGTDYYAYRNETIIGIPFIPAAPADPEVEAELKKSR